MSCDSKVPVVLLCCGSFNPITTGHIRLFELGREFLDEIGNYAVIGGIMSPVHDACGSRGLIAQKHRIAMCKLATHAHRWIRGAVSVQVGVAWLLNKIDPPPKKSAVMSRNIEVKQIFSVSVDTWETEQTQWSETIKVLRHHSKKIKELYDSPTPTSAKSTNNNLSTKWAVTLQPGAKNSKCNHVSVPLRSTSTGQSGGQRIVPHPMTPYLTNKNRSPSLNLMGADDVIEINEASEPNRTGQVFNKLGENIQKVCCVAPTPFGYQPGMVYGANCDFRKTKIMLLCGSELLESFLVPGLWEEDHIREIVSQYGIVCVTRPNGKPSSLTTFNPCSVGLNRTKNDTIHESLEYLYSITRNLSGSIFLVNDNKTSELSSMTSTKLRQSILEGSEAVKHVANPCVLRYIQHHALYTRPDEAG